MSSKKYIVYIVVWGDTARTGVAQALSKVPTSRMICFFSSWHSTLSLSVCVYCIMRPVLGALLPKYKVYSSLLNWHCILLFSVCGYLRMRSRVFSWLNSWKKKSGSFLSGFCKFFSSFRVGRSTHYSFLPCSSFSIFLSRTWRHCTWFLSPPPHRFSLL
jgi:hypothetical protein